MNYKQWLVPYLTGLEDWKKFAADTPTRIAELEDEAWLLKASRTDKISVMGGGDSGDAQIIGSLAEREELAWKLKITQGRIRWIEAGLEELDEQERTILTRFYIHRTRDAVWRLMDELGVEQSQVYRLKDRAMEHLARLLTGIPTA